MKVAQELSDVVLNTQFSNQSTEAPGNRDRAVTVTANRGLDQTQIPPGEGLNLNDQIWIITSLDDLKLDSHNPKSFVVQTEDSSKSSANSNPNVTWVRLPVPAL